MTRDEAIKNDEIKYLGTPCKREHEGWRYLSGGACVECMTARFLAHSPETRKAYLATSKKYQNNPKNVFVNLLKYSKRNAKKLGLDFNMTRNDLIKLWDEQKGLCYYDGTPMSKDRGIKHRNNDRVSIDRIDSNKGYVLDNIVLCKVWSNMAKNDLSQEEFINRCRVVAAFATQ